MHTPVGMKQLTSRASPSPPGSLQTKDHTEASRPSLPPSVAFFSFGCTTGHIVLTQPGSTAPEPAVEAQIHWTTKDIIVLALRWRHKGFPTELSPSPSGTTSRRAVSLLKPPLSGGSGLTERKGARSISKLSRGRGDPAGSGSSQALAFFPWHTQCKSCLTPSSSPEDSSHLGPYIWQP